MPSELARQAFTRQYRQAEDHGKERHLDATIMDRSRLHDPRQITDAYLLALAVAHGGHFVTFDRSLSVAVVRGATEDQLTVL